MTKLPVRFDRIFHVRAYSVSHSQLLLRSDKGDRYKTRIDVLFKDVHLIHLPVHAAGLSIAEISRDDFLTQRLSIGRGSETGNRYFRLQGDDWTGLIVAGTAAWIEDDAEQNEKSKLFDAPSAPYV